METVQAGGVTLNKWNEQNKKNKPPSDTVLLEDKILFLLFPADATMSCCTSPILCKITTSDIIERCAHKFSFTPDERTSWRLKWGLKAEMIAEHSLYQTSQSVVASQSGGSNHRQLNR